MRGGIAKGKCSKVMLEAVAARVIQLGVSCANDMMKIRLVPASPLAEKECMAHPCVGSYPPAQGLAQGKGIKHKLPRVSC